ncbi:MAG: TlyA family RNA methyltransferase [Candidatus Paceibacterota bacterium]|jgi:23S rRNA (cytidine1920-2'-O)/16S rRNA (cytidine1409-2'-O)-methyltransferase
MERLDKLLLLKQLVTSRNDAQKLIEAGKVKVSGQVIIKNHTKFDENVKIEVDSENNLVSRAGAKLQQAIDEFKLNVNDWVCLDVGASTGGFTECLLNNGAKKVYSVDVGSDQLDEKLRDDKRVINLEKTDIRQLEKLDEAVDFITVDVSFISILKVLPFLKKFLKNDGQMVLLIKPQFEIKGDKNKQGKVKDDILIKEAVSNIKNEVGKEYKILGAIESMVTGKKGGNKEFLM